MDYPACGDDGLVDAVRRGASRHGSEIVLPVDDTQLLALSRRRDELGALLPYPEHEVVVRATDRLELARAAERTGLAPPHTVSTVEAVAALSDERVVVKARSPRLHETSGGWSRFETRIGTARSARGWIAEIESAGGEAVVQKLVGGSLASLTLLTTPDQQLVAQIQQRAGGIWPVGAGSSTRASTVAVDPELSARALAFARDLRWHGLAQFQFLVGEDGVPRLIDFNPRFYGSLSLAIGAGIDFPSLWAASVTGRPLPARASGRTGVRYQWLGGDLRRAVRERRGNLVTDLAGSLRWGASAVRPIWSLRDPLPALTHGLEFVRSRS